MQGIDVVIIGAGTAGVAADGMQGRADEASAALAAYFRTGPTAGTIPSCVHNHRQITQSLWHSVSGSMKAYVAQGCWNNERAIVTE
jgi:thioredoxin reductase